MSKHVVERIKQAFADALSQGPTGQVHPLPKPEPKLTIRDLEQSSIASVEKDVNYSEKQKSKFNQNTKTLVSLAMTDPKVRKSPIMLRRHHERFYYVGSIDGPLPNATRLIEEAMQAVEPRKKEEKKSLVQKAADKKIF